MSDVHLEQWRALWQRLDCRAPDDSVLDDLLTRYREAHRHYHTLQHLDECLALRSTVRAIAEHPDEVELALWFHDVIYVLRAPDNEHRSAEWATVVTSAVGLPDIRLQRVRALILATAHGADAQGVDAETMVDVDLVSLGATPARFDECESQLRLEMPWVADAEYRLQRKAALERFQARPRLYRTAAFHDRFERAARRNLAAKLNRLEKGLT